MVPKSTVSRIYLNSNLFPFRWVWYDLWDLLFRVRVQIMWLGQWAMGLWCVVLRWFGSVIIFCCASGSKINCYSMEISWFGWSFSFVFGTHTRAHTGEWVSHFLFRLLYRLSVMKQQPNKESSERQKKNSNQPKHFVSLLYYSAFRFIATKIGIN